MANLYSQTIKQAFSGGVVSECRVDGCQLKLRGFPREHVIVNVDRVMSSGEPGRRCDHVIVSDDLKNVGKDDVFLIPVEFKSNLPHIDKVKEQLEGGIALFFSHIPNHAKCYPVIVTKKLGHHVRNQLLKFPVNYKGRDIWIKHVICNKILTWKTVKKAI